MASQGLERLAKEAFIDDNFELAVDLYTQALELSPKTAGLFADRAQANLKLNKFSEALNDTNRAIELDPSMSKAFLRKGMALLKLHEYETAKSTLQAGVLLAPEDIRFTGLVRECDSHIEKTIYLSQDLPISVSASVDKINDRTEDPISSTSNTSKVVVVLNPKYRHNYYNSLTEVVITIFAKSVPTENVSVDFGEQIVDIDVPGEETYHFQKRLFGKIVPDKCRYAVMSSKVEIHLFKAETITWTSLEFSDRKIISQQNNVPSARTMQRPSYPSSKSKIDWDKLEAEVKREEKEEKLDGDAAVNKIFGDIYKSVDEDTRRAMNKSFVESNGTVLSTNWKEVGSKKVDGSAPEGMKIKKWEY